MLTSDRSSHSFSKYASVWTLTNWPRFPDQYFEVVMKSLPTTSLRSSSKRVKGRFSFALRSCSICSCMAANWPRSTEIDPRGFPQSVLFHSFSFLHFSFFHILMGLAPFRTSFKRYVYTLTFHVMRRDSSSAMRVLSSLSRITLRCCFR